MRNIVFFQHLNIRYHLIVLSIWDAQLGQYKRVLSGLEQWSPAFLAPGTGFMEDNFSTDGGGGCVCGGAWLVQAVMGRDGVQWGAMGSSR